MKLLIPTLVTVGTAVQGWHWGQAYTPMLLRMSPASFMLERQRSLAQRMFDQTGISSPRYELVDDENKFQLSVDVPGVKEEDIEIQLEDGLLLVKGRRVAATESSRFSSRFSQAFSLDRTVDVDKFTAQLTNGVLTITAPKDIKKLDETVRRIPIATSASPNEMMAPKTEASAEENIGSQHLEIPVSDTKKTTKADEEETDEINLDVEK
jgi:HSP20 family molecular chaperone IbpA